MKRKISFLLTGLSLLMLFMSNFAFIYEVRVLRKWDAVRKRYHYFIGCSDFHDKTDISNKTQLKKIESVLSKCDKNKTNITVEDLSSVNVNGRSTCGRYFVNSRGGILGGLAQTSQHMGLNVSNVEFRYCRVVALGPVLNNLNDDLKNFPSAAKTTINDLRQEIEDEMKHIQAYDDKPALKKQYDIHMRAIRDQFKNLHFDRDGHLTVAQYLDKNSTKTNRLELLKILLTFDSSLLDLKSVHEVTHNSSTHDLSIAFEGGAHIGRISEMLQKFDDYKEDAYTTKVVFAREHDLQKCLGSNIIDGAFCVKPQPIELDILDDVILSK